MVGGFLSYFIKQCCSFVHPKVLTTANYVHPKVLTTANYTFSEEEDIICLEYCIKTMIIFSDILSINMSQKKSQ
jgi:hypothetical protein